MWMVSGVMMLRPRQLACWRLTKTLSLTCGDAASQTVSRLVEQGKRRRRGERDGASALCQLPVDGEDLVGAHAPLHELVDARDEGRLRHPSEEGLLHCV